MASRYWVGGTGSWTEVAHWSDSNGGGGGFSVPGQLDDVYFTNLSGAGTCTMNVDGGECKNLSFNGWTGTFTCTSSVYDLRFFGSLYIDANVVWHFNGYMNPYSNIPDASITILQALTWGGSHFTFYGAAAGCGWKLMSDLNIGLGSSNGYIALSRGKLDTNGFNIYCNGFAGSKGSGGEPSSLYLRNSTIYVGQAAVSASWAMSTDFPTFDIGTSTIYCSGLFSGGNFAYNNVILYGSAACTIADSSTFNNLQLGVQGTTKTITFTAGTTQTILNDLICQGTITANITWASSTTSPYYITKASGNVYVSGVAMSRCTAQGGATFRMNYASTNGTGNVGWDVTELSNRIFCLDQDNGSDSAYDPVGWWKVAYTGGTGPMPVVGELVTGLTSGKTANVMRTPYSASGEWDDGDAAGDMFFYGKSGTFVAEEIDFAGGGHAHITADLSYSSWKTISAGPTAARIKPSDTIRIAKSPTPTLLCNATWTDRSKTVTLLAAQTVTIDRCEVAWTPSHGQVVRDAVATDGKEGSYCMRIVEDTTAPGLGEMQAYYPTGDLNLTTCTKISFWLKSSVVLTAGKWVICLCSNADGTGVVDSFPIPAIAAASKWQPLTLARTGGGFLGGGGTIKSIAVYNGAATMPVASTYIRLDNIIGCTADGLNLQSLISSNSAEQGGDEGWFGIQSIVGTTVLLDNHTDNKANAGRGWSGTTGSYPTYKRETTKTAMAAAQTTKIAQYQDVGTAGNLISYKGGYDTGTNQQTGETMFDGLNGYGYGLNIYQRCYYTYTDYLNFFRYDVGIYVAYDSTNNSFGVISNLNNNSTNGFLTGEGGTDYITIAKISNLCNNGSYGFAPGAGRWGIVTSLVNINSNLGGGASIRSGTQYWEIATVTNVNNNNGAGWEFGQGLCNYVALFINVLYNTSYGVAFTSSTSGNLVGEVRNSRYNSGYGLAFAQCMSNVVLLASNISNNVSAGIYFSDAYSNVIGVAVSSTNTGYGVYSSSSRRNVIRKLTTSGNTSGGVYTSGADIIIHDLTIAETTKITGMAYGGDITRITKYGTVGNNWIYDYYATANSQPVTRVGATGWEWKLAVTGVYRSWMTPFEVCIARIAVKSGSRVTVKAYFTKSSASAIGAKLICRANQVAGVDTDQVATKANDLLPQELTIYLDPTEDGVVEILASVYWITASAYVLVDSMTISQA